MSLLGISCIPWVSKQLNVHYDSTNFVFPHGSMHLGMLRVKKWFCGTLLMFHFSLLGNRNLFLDYGAGKPF